MKQSEGGKTDPEANYAYALLQITLPSSTIRVIYSQNATVIRTYHSPWRG